jgi:hypothetical protein
MSRIFSSAEPGPQLTWTAMYLDNRICSAACSGSKGKINDTGAIELANSGARRSGLFFARAPLLTRANEVKVGIRVSVQARSLDWNEDMQSPRTEEISKP